MIELARLAAGDAGLTNLTFIEGGFDVAFAERGALDAVVGPLSGLVVQRVRAEANVLTPTSSYPVGAIIRSVLPRLLHLGITTEAEVDVDTLDHRLAAERRERNATCLWEMVFCAWARKP